MPEPGTAGERGDPGTAPFGFVQLEFGRLLGPPDGRYLVRDEPDGPLRALLLLATLGAPERRRLRAGRRRAAARAAPTPVPTARATVVKPDPFDSPALAESWLAGLRRDRRRAGAEVDEAARVLNRALHAHRVAAADPYAADVSPAHALVVRIGFGAGDALADGRYQAAWEPPRRGPRRARRSMEAPEERFAGILGGRERPLAAEELVLRARLDLDAGRMREASLEARAALEGLLAELGPAPDRAGLESCRAAIEAAAEAAGAGALPPGDAVVECVGRMESALRRHRLRS